MALISSGYLSCSQICIYNENQEGILISAPCSNSSQFTQRLEDPLPSSSLPWLASWCRRGLEASVPLLTDFHMGPCQAAWTSSQHGGWAPAASILRDRKWRLLASKELETGPKLLLPYFSDQELSELDSSIGHRSHLSVREAVRHFGFKTISA